MADRLNGGGAEGGCMGSAGYCLGSEPCLVAGLGGFDGFDRSQHLDG